MKNNSFRFICVGAAFVSMGLLAANAQAIIFNFTGNSGSNGQALAAKAEFLVSGTNVTIILTNTATAAANDGANVLGGLYFSLGGPRTFTNGNAFLTAGSNLVKKNDNSSQSGNPLNNEWMYKAPIVSTGGQSNFNNGYGIGSTGFNFSTNANTFDEMFHGGNASAGANDDYGLVPLLGMTAGNTSNLYIRNSATFTFNVNATFGVGDIQNVRVSYGSAGQTVINAAAVPEPGTIAVLGLGVLAVLRKRRR